MNRRVSPRSTMRCFLSIRMTSDLLRDLYEAAEREHRPVSQVVRSALRQYLAVLKSDARRQKKLPFSKAK